MPINQLEAQRFGRMELMARKAVEGLIAGRHRSPFHGFSVEFAEHRGYNNGESTRHIDWKLYGRTDKLYTKRYEEETNLRCFLVVDASGSMHFPVESLSKLQFSAQCAASIAYLMRSQRDAFGFCQLGNGVIKQLPARGTVSHQKALFTELDNLYDSPKGDEQSLLANGFHQLAETLPRRSFVVIFSDFLDTLERGESAADGLFKGLQHLLHNKHEIIAFDVAHHQQELQLEFDNRPHRFVDLETGAQVKLNPAEVKEGYMRLRAERLASFRNQCFALGITLVPADVASGVSPVLDAFLAKRALLG